MHSNGVWMVMGRELRYPILLTGREPGDMLYLQIAENPMVSFACRLFPKEAEKQENIAFTDMLIVKMRLRRSALAEQAFTLRQKHGVMVAQFVGTEPAPACFTGKVAQAQVTIGGTGIATTRYRQAHRAAIDNRRWATAGRTVEPFPAEYYSHASRTAPRFRT